MNLLLVSPLPLPEGGIATWTTNFIESDFVLGNKVEIINTSKIINNKRNKYIVEFHRLMKVLQDIDRKTNEKDFKIAHVNTSCGLTGMLKDILIVIKLRRKKIDCIIQCHCDVRDQLKSKISFIIFKTLMKMSKEVLVLDSKSSNFIDTQFSIKNLIVPNFIAKNKIICEEKNIKKNIETIVYIGRIEKAKGSDVIFEVAEQLPDIKFVLIGSFMEELRAKKIPRNLIIKGVLDNQEVINQLKESDLFLFPSLSEGFPMAVLEAMSQGVPIISTAVGAVRDMLEDQGGEILENGTKAEIVKSILNLSQNQHLRKTYSKWNIEKVKAAYTDEKVIEKLYNIYKSN